MTSRPRKRSLATAISWRGARVCCRYPPPARHDHGWEMRMRRTWAMPTSHTFDCPPIASLLLDYCKGVSVDPFAGDSGVAWHTNDLNPATQAKSHLPAEVFLADLLAKFGSNSVDTVLFDPPYSPRQISECYAAAGLTASMKDTQNAALYARCRELIEQLVRPGGHVLSFGWNSCGMGKAWERIETLLVAHGGAHNDTICVVDRKHDTIAKGESE